MLHSRQYGFTLVEMAIVLVIIGLILGAAFKGKDLIDGAKVKNMAAQVNKMQAAFNVYYEKYGAYPGDGCAALVTTQTLCSGAKNGSLGLLENNSAPLLLVNAGILSAADMQSVFGVPWVITEGTAITNYTTAHNYMTPGTQTSAGVTTQQDVDVRFVCALDRAIDDGVPTTGNVRSSATNAATQAGAAAYTNDGGDCWALAGNGSVGIRVLP
ncbi:type II secretion system protein [Chitinibacter sp. GC72]|uniref:type II secretion system protein n=1 Tax=Chitinibacter sp. GC72 TaxID=1526917 RepID=UPI0012FC717E|nr:prepilin-type N-terminal cleavage/methylation domain-containing protein [Chitinibacter sp. GC72]